MTWDELINSNTQAINLVGYGSLLNVLTIHNNKTQLSPVEVMDYKRVFNCYYLDEMIEKRKSIFFEYSNRLQENQFFTQNVLSKEFRGALNVEFSKGTVLNGLSFEVKKEEFEGYKQREIIYTLEEVKVNYTDAQQCFLNNNKTYILVCKNEYVKNSEPFYIYYKVCRNGAYSFGSEFGELFDNSTFYLEEKCVDFIRNKYFKIGTEVIVSNVMITIEKFPGEKQEVLKHFNLKGKVISGFGGNVEVFFDNGDKVFYDFGDLSLISDIYS